MTAIFLIQNHYPKPAAQKLKKPIFTNRFPVETR